MTRKPRTPSDLSEKKTRIRSSAKAAKDKTDTHPFAQKFSFLYDHKFIDSFIWVPIIGLVITIMAGMLFPFDDKHKAPWDFFGSWALVGFLAYCTVVLCAEPLFKLLAQPEDYYGEGDDD